MRGKRGQKGTKIRKQIKCNKTGVQGQCFSSQASTDLT